MSTAGDTHAARMDAHAYWNQFAPVWDPVESGDELIGTVEHLGEVKIREEWHPRIKIRTDNGGLVVVLATQKRLLAELVRFKPKIGDRIKIRYLGTDERAAPGMQPTQRYAVAVRGPQGQEPA